MKLATRYLGLQLKNPLVASASPLFRNLDNVRRLEEAGAAALVLPSLFEEQIVKESLELQGHLVRGTESYAESLNYFPEPQEFPSGPDEYLEMVARAKTAASIPVIGSLNGYTPGGWMRYARLIQDAGADALELNIHFIPTDLESDAAAVEARYLDIVRNVRAAVSIPLAVKIGPFFSAMGHMAKSLAEAGADGLVLFNRFYQPDIDVERLEVAPDIILSTPMSLRLPLRWIAILHGRLKASLAATGGIHEAADVLKVVMAGADAAMVCSALYKNGVGHARTILEGMARWMEEREYESVEQMRGSMSHKNCGDPEAFERAYYVKAVRSDALVPDPRP